MSYAVHGMRCPTCGTENVPDSRFCGACGAKLTPAVVSRVAPTAKIPDDAPFPASHLGTPSQPPANNYNSNPPSIPPANYQPQPASIPPNTYIAPHYGTGPASIPPSAGYAPSAPGYAAREPSLSMPVAAQTRWGLIAVLLLLDVGLAGAGSFLLMKGLAKPPAPDVPVEKASPKAGSSSAPAKAATVTAPAPAPNLAASVTAIAQTAPEPAARPAAPAAPAAPAPAAPVVTKKPAAAKAKAAPEDPYAPTKSLAAEIELAASRSKDDFAGCHAHASGEIHGRIDVQFTVQPDGSVGGVKATQNTTYATGVADCIIGTISRWSFASHPANPTDFVRPFIYQ